MNDNMSALDKEHEEILDQLQQAFNKKDETSKILVKYLQGSDITLRKKMKR